MDENDDDEDEQTVSEDNDRYRHSVKTLPGSKKRKLAEDNSNSVGSPQFFQSVKVFVFFVFFLNILEKTF
jgi:hypothetical protein